MPKSLALVLVACACTGNPKSPPTGSAPADGGGGPSGLPSSPSNGGGGAPSDLPSSPSNDPRSAPSDPTLLESGAKTVFAVSPDERRVLLSHQLASDDTNSYCSRSDFLEVSLVTIGAVRAAAPLGITARAAWFSPDSRFILSSQVPCEGTPDQAWIANADGSGLRAVSTPGYYSFAGPWLYSVGEEGLYRQNDLNDPPQLVHRSGRSDFRWSVSPDGQAIAYCDGKANDIPADCHVQGSIAATPIALPAPDSQFFSWIWSSDGSWLLQTPCTIYDRASNSVWSCDSTRLAQPPVGCSATVSQPTCSSFVDDDVFIFTTRDDDGFRVHLRVIAGGDEIMLPALPWIPSVMATPDHSTVVAWNWADAFVSNHDLTVAVAPANGGDWTPLANDVVQWGTAPFRSIVAIHSRSKGMLWSNGGGPASSIDAPGLNPQTLSAPAFEPEGGLDKMLVSGTDSAGVTRTVIGNADGSGQWIPVPSDFGPRFPTWAGHSAIMTDKAGQVFLVPDDGSAPQRVAANAGWITTAAAATRVFYLDPAGLHVVDNPRR